MTFDQDNRTVFLLAPLAVMTARHGQGIGQKLLNNALKFLREANVDVVMTYGDPNYYNKVSFQSVSENQAAAPFKLQYPHGWLGLSLTEQTLLPLKGRSHCVSALNDPVFW